MLVGRGERHAAARPVAAACWTWASWASSRTRSSASWGRSRRRFGLVPVTGARRSGPPAALSSSIAALNGPDTHVVTVEKPVESSSRVSNQIAIQKAERRERGSGAAIAAPRGRRRRPGQRHRGPRDREGRIQPGGTGTPRALHAPRERRSLHREVRAGAHGPRAPYLLATAHLCARAQRLVRRVARSASGCATRPTSRRRYRSNWAPSPRRSAPSRSCRAGAARAFNGTGWRGQVGLFEVMEVTGGLPPPFPGRGDRGRDQADGRFWRGMFALRAGAGGGRIKRRRDYRQGSASERCRVDARGGMEAPKMPIRLGSCC